MRMKYWILLSIAIHLVIMLFFSLKISFGEKKYIDLSYLTITDFNERKEDNEVKKIIVEKKEGDITPTEQKIEETNVVENVASANNFDQSKFMPFYLVDELPVPLVKIAPQYPEEARRLGVEGVVVLKIYIDEEGRVEEVEVIKSPNELLSVVSKKTLMNVKFKPAKAGGRFVPVCIELTLRFKLSG
ncbi:MAG: energy transducer TonB [Brevinematia bacterium]